MMSFHRHMDNASSVLQCLPVDRNENMAEEREETFSPSSPSSSLLQDISQEKPRKPRLLMIREELVDLTGDPLSASLLGQLLYWSQKVKDLDLFIEEEKNSSSKSRSSLQHGWFSKSPQELIEETMLRVTIMTFRRYLNFLINQGWVETRRNPQNKWNRPRQYRVSLRKLCTDLQKHGYSLPDFAAYGAEQSACEESRLKEVRFETKVEDDFSTEERDV